MRVSVWVLAALAWLLTGFLRVSVSVATAEGPGVAAASPSLAGVYGCQGVVDGAARLACYDAAVAGLKAAEEAGEVRTISRAEVTAVQKEAFGFTMPSLPKLAFPKIAGKKSASGVPEPGEDGELTSLSAAVESIRGGGTGRDASALTVALGNGQVWQQTDDKPVLVPGRGQPKQAVVKRAALGSFKMKLDEGLAFRVKRVQ